MYPSMEKRPRTLFYGHSLLFIITSERFAGRVENMLLIIRIILKLLLLLLPRLAVVKNRGSMRLAFSLSFIMLSFLNNWSLLFKRLTRLVFEMGSSIQVILQITLDRQKNEQDRQARITTGCLVHPMPQYAIQSSIKTVTYDNCLSFSTCPQEKEKYCPLRQGLVNESL